MVGGAGHDGGFGDGLAGAARSIIADARRALTDPELSDPEAVHDVRKALKRWRALMRLLARGIGEPADQMRMEARELMRALSGARDAQSALDALADLKKSELPFSATSAETIRKRLTEMRDAAEKAGFSAADARQARALPRLRHAFARKLAAQGHRLRHGRRRPDRHLPARAPTGARRLAERRARASARSAPARGRAPPPDGSDRAAVAAARTGLGRGGAALAQSARRLPGPRGARAISPRRISRWRLGARG